MECRTGKYKWLDMVSPVRGDMKGLHTIKVKELANFARILLKD